MVLLWICRIGGMILFVQEMCVSGWVRCNPRDFTLDLGVIGELSI